MPSDASKFAGSWALQSMVGTTHTGQIYHPYGQSPLGRITYTSSGHMHAVLMDAARPPLAVPIEEFGPLGAAGRTRLVLRRLPALLRFTATALRATAYSGTWVLDGDTVVHHVDASILPDWMGTTLVRTFEFREPDTLVLTARDIVGGTIALTWHRLNPGETL